MASDRESDLTRPRAATHGGYRPGAGRKSKQEIKSKMVRLPSLRVTDKTLAAIEQWRTAHNLTRRTDAIRQMLDAAGRSQT